MRKLIASMAVVAAALGIGLTAAPAGAAFALEGLDVGFTDCKGAPAMEAGSHPCAWTTEIGVKTTVSEGIEVPDEEARDVLFELPPGLIGNPSAVPRCSAADFSAGGAVEENCPVSSALGHFDLVIGFGEPGSVIVPVYNLEPPPGVAARIGFKPLGVPVVVDATLKPDPPYNVVAASTNISQAIYFYRGTLTLWGDPTSSEHDSERGRCLNFGGTCEADTAEKAFTVMPRSCSGPLRFGVRARSWKNPGAWLSYLLETHNGAEPPQPIGVRDCTKLGLAATTDAKPTTDQAESPSGLAFDLDITNPGLTSPDGVSDSDIKKAVVTLPEGMTINPSQAEGLLGCTPQSFAGETADSAPGQGCPEASKIGSVEVETPLLENEILRGSLFVAEPFDNPFDSLIALYMTVKSPRYGVDVGLAGKVVPDPETGQLVTTFGDPSAGEGFDELPQLPFSHFRLRFREGGRAPLITPPQCGQYEVEALFTPWANPGDVVPSTSTFDVTRGVGGAACPSGGQPFVPGFAAGAVNNAAGEFSPFSMRITRRDGDQDLTRFDATLPSGMLAKLVGVSKCPEAQIALARTKTGKAELASPSCPLNSRIGRVQGGAGVGSQLTYVPGTIYLAGPFAGEPLSVVSIVPAVAGPFDVGNIVTRFAVVVDPVTARVTIDGSRSEPIPHILAGIPLRVRDIHAHVDRSGFTLNPTSCDPKRTDAYIWGGGANPFTVLDDSPVARSARFQAAGCARLGFRPRLGLRLRGATRRGANPALRAVLRPRQGHANIERTVVRLPRSAFLDQAHIRTICTRVQFAADNCPKGAIYGHVTAFTPLLAEPLRGPAYLRSSTNKLPDLVFDLHGIVDVEVSARIDSIRGGIRASFNRVPDAPLSKVVVRMQGGKKGLIVNSRNLCRGKNRANVRLDAHSGRQLRLRPLVRPQHCKKGKRAKRSNHRARVERR